MGQTTIIIALGILLVLSGFFSATETAFSSVNIIRIKQYAKSSKKQLSKKAKRVIKLQEDYAIFLSTVLVGNNIVNMASSSLATYLFATTYSMGESGVLLATVIMSVLVIIFGEIIPKTLARTWSEKFTMFASGIMSLLVVVLKPITILFGKFDEKMNSLVDEDDKVTATEEELIDIVEKIEREGVLEHQESELIQSAITFDSKSVRNVMTNKEKVQMVKTTDTFEEIGEFFREQQYTRAPVYDVKEDRIVGIINQKDVFSCYVNDTHKTAEELMDEAIYISHRRLIPYALEMLQKNKSHLAIVVDNVKDKHFLGIITLEDILEELVGEIYDEHDDSPSQIFQIGNHLYQVRGNVTLDNLFDNYLTDTDFPRTKGKTVNEWVKEVVVEPVKNMEFYYDNLKVTLLEIEEEKTELIEIEVLTDYDEE